MKKFFLSVIILILIATPVSASERTRWNADGKYRRAFVVDAGLSALRSSPSATSVCLRRLRPGRSLYVISSHGNYFYVAITRRTRGFIDRAAIVSPSKKGDDARLMRLIEAADGIDRIALSRMMNTYFSKSPFCPDALMAEGLAAEKAALELSLHAFRKLRNVNDKELPPERYWVNFPGLDRYSRLGVRFRVDIEKERFYYNGAAYKRILARYSHSDAAAKARERLEEIEEEREGDGN